jgi:hypothetical protein
MRDVNVFGAGLMLGFAICEMGQRQWAKMSLSLAIFALNVACVVWA